MDSANLGREVGDMDVWDNPTEVRQQSCWQTKPSVSLSLNPPECEVMDDWQ